MSAIPCVECNGDTIRHRGTGTSIEQWVCPNFRAVGHLSEAEMLAKRKAYLAEYGPKEADGSPKWRFA